MLSEYLFICWPGIEPTSLVSPALTGGFFTTVPRDKNNTYS